MGEWEVDSCTGVNRRSLCVLPTKICDQLSVSVPQGGILVHFGWVYGEDTWGRSLVRESLGALVVWWLKIRCSVGHFQISSSCEAF